VTDAPTSKPLPAAWLFANVFVVATCGLVGVDCRPAGDRVRIYRRPSVELMLEHVGRKA